MRLEAFEIAVTLTNMKHDHPTTEAAKLVLVEGAKGIEAAEATGQSTPAISRAVSRIRDVIEKAEALVEALNSDTCHP